MRCFQNQVSSGIRCVHDLFKFSSLFLRVAGGFFRIGQHASDCVEHFDFRSRLCLSRVCPALQGKLAQQYVNDSPYILIIAFFFSNSIISKQMIFESMMSMFLYNFYFLNIYYFSL